MADDGAPVTCYKEGGFTDEGAGDLPIKVHICAPSTLPEGFVFEAEVGGPNARKTISVEVVSREGKTKRTSDILPCRLEVER